MILSKQAYPTNDSELRAFNPNASEYITGASSATSPVPDKFSSAASQRKHILYQSDDKTHQHWQPKLPDDYAMGEHEYAAPLLSDLPLHERSEATEPAASGASGYMKNGQPEFASYYTNAADKLCVSLIICGHDPSSSSDLRWTSNSWEIQLPSSDSHSRKGTANDQATEAVFSVNNHLNPLEILASQFPGFAVDSLTEVYLANDCDLNLTIGMLSELEIPPCSGKPDSYVDLSMADTSQGDEKSEHQSPICESNPSCVVRDQNPTTSLGHMNLTEFRITVEYYLCKCETRRGTKLKNMIRDSEDGMISVAFICTFCGMLKRSLGLEDDVEVVPENILIAAAAILRESKCLKVSRDGKRVGPRDLKEAMKGLDNLTTLESSMSNSAVLQNEITPCSGKPDSYLDLSMADTYRRDGTSEHDSHTRKSNPSCVVQDQKPTTALGHMNLTEFRIMVEYYLCKCESRRGTKLKNMIKDSEDGMISVAFICTFCGMLKRSLGLEDDVEAVPEDILIAAGAILRESKRLKVSIDGKRVGPRDLKEALKELDNLTILGSSMSHSVELQNEIMPFTGEPASFVGLSVKDTCHGEGRSLHLADMRMLEPPSSLDERTSKHVKLLVESLFRDDFFPLDPELKNMIIERDGEMVSVASICLLSGAVKDCLGLEVLETDDVPDDIVKAVGDVLRNSDFLEVSMDGKTVGKRCEVEKLKDLKAQVGSSSRAWDRVRKLTRWRSKKGDSSKLGSSDWPNGYVPSDLLCA